MGTGNVDIQQRLQFLLGTLESNKPVKLAPRKKKEPSTRKKKKKATRPGYGNMNGSPSEM